MFQLRLDLQRVLEQAGSAQPSAAAGWFDEPPAGTHTARVSTRLPGDDLSRYADALLGWRVHEASGLPTLAHGPARAGRDVAVGTRLGPVWLAFACRVLSTVDEPGRAGFTYVTMPGHPETGVEEFLVVRDADGLRFDIRSVSREAVLPARLARPVARVLQARATDRYLVAARRLPATG